MTIHITTPQIIYLAAYILLFAFLLAWFVVFSNNYPRKNYEELIPHFGLFIIILALFVAGEVGVFSLVEHFNAASFLLITLKWNHTKDDYWLYKTEMLTEEEAVKASWFFTNHKKQVEKFYRYLLIDDQNNMQTFLSTMADLLEYIKENIKNIPEIKTTQEPPNK